MTRQRFLAALAALLLLVSAAGPAIGAVAGDRGGDVLLSHDPKDSTGEMDWNDTEPADDAYVTDDGDVILVYEYDQNDSDEDSLANTTGHAGVNVSAGLAHLDMTVDNVETNATGNVTMWAKQDGVVANGTMAAPKPANLTNLDMNLESLSNDTERYSTMSLNSTVGIPQDAAMLGLLDEIKTAGYVTSDATSLESNGSFTVSALMMPIDREHHIVLTEDEDSYTLSVDEEYTLQASEFGGEPTDGWESEDAAQATLERQYCMGTTGSGLSCAVTVDSYSLADGEQPRLDIEYTVEFQGVDTTVSEAISTGLSQPSTNVSAETAERLSQRIQNVTLSRVQADFVAGGSQAALSWNVSMDGTDDLALAYADLLEVMQQSATSQMPGGPEMMAGGQFGGSPGEMAEQIRAQVAAQRASGSAGTTTWDASFNVAGDKFHLNATLDSQTENWESYVTELEATDAFNETPDTRLSLSAETVGDQIVVDGAMRYEKPELFDEALAEYNETFTRMANQSGTATDEATKNVTEFFSTVDAMHFQRARMDMALDGQQMTVEGAIAVENASAVSDAIPNNASMITDVYTDFEGRETVVTLGGAVDSEADEDAVRELSVVGENTTVSLAGEWDRSFASMNETAVQAYLGLDEDGEDDSGVSMTLVAGGAAAAAATAGGGVVLFKLFV